MRDSKIWQLSSKSREKMPTKNYHFQSTYKAEDSESHKNVTDEHKKKKHFFWCHVCDLTLLISLKLVSISDKNKSSHNLFKITKNWRGREEIRDDLVYV